MFYGNSFYSNHTFSPKWLINCGAKPVKPIITTIQKVLLSFKYGEYATFVFAAKNNHCHIFSFSTSEMTWFSLEMLQSSFHQKCSMAKANPIYHIKEGESETYQKAGGRGWL